MSKQQQFFFVIADTTGENALSFERKEAGPRGDWRVNDMDDPDIKVYKTEAVAMAKVTIETERIIKVHRDFLDVAAIPE
jgi:hypothetical protein